MNYFRTLTAVLFCVMILPVNAQDKDCFAGLENELSSILKEDSKSSRILKIGSKLSKIPRKVVRWNRKKICKQFNMIFANICQSDLISSDTIIVVRKSQEYLYLGDDKAFFAIKCLPNQQHYSFIINTTKKGTIIKKNINSFDRFNCIINLALKDSSELFNKNNSGTVFTDDLYMYSICMIIRKNDLFHINYYRTLGQEIFREGYMRGKEVKSVEFGAKCNNILVDGISFNAFNGGATGEDRARKENRIARSSRL